MAGLSLDLTDLTAEEMVLLGEALGCETKHELDAKMAIAQKMIAEDGNFPMWIIVPAVWLARRSEDPTFTLERARKMPLTRLVELIPKAAAPGATSPTSSPVSVGSPISPSEASRAVRRAARKKKKR